jgi:hypothetical protein
MKVSELIEALQKCDQELEVTYINPAGMPYYEDYRVWDVRTLHIAKPDRDWTWVQIR